MHPYLPYLLSDIATAHREKTSSNPEKELPLDENQAFLKHIEEVERYLHGEGYEHDFGYYCGLKPNDFPPVTQFSDSEIEQVFEAFQEMMSTWNVQIQLPDKLPLQLRYEFMIKTLGEEFTPMDEGFIVYDFCSGYAPGCDFKEYCPCLDFWNEASVDME